MRFRRPGSRPNLIVLASAYRASCRLLELHKMDRVTDMRESIISIQAALVQAQRAKGVMCHCLDAVLSSHKDSDSDLTFL